MKVYLLRHGQTEYNKTGLVQDAKLDIDITEQAVQEIQNSAVEINNFLIEQHCTFAMCSTKLRALHTLKLLQQSVTCPIQNVAVIHDLDEVDFGIFGSQFDALCTDSAGKTMQQYRNRIKHDLMLSGTSYVQFQDGESIKHIQERCKHVIELLKSFKHRYESILLVGHNRLFRHLLVELGVWQPEQMFDTKLPHNKLVFACDI